MPRSRPTQRRIAQEAEVSRATVSLVLNDSPGVRISPETRQRILEVACRLNHYPDAAGRTLVSGRTHTIGFILYQSPDRVFADAFLPEVLRGVGDAVQENDLRVLIHSVEDVTAPEAYIGLVREKHTDGIILSGPRSDDEQLPLLDLSKPPTAAFVACDLRRSTARRRRHSQWTTTAPSSATRLLQRSRGWLRRWKVRGSSTSTPQPSTATRRRC